MKISKLIKLSLTLTAILLPTFTSCAASVAAFTLPEIYEDRFAENNIVFYDPCAGGGTANNTVNTNPGSSTTPGIVTGNSNEEKIWNYIVSKGIEHISDSAEVIAGIMGNLKQESNYDPFSHGGSYYGLFQTSFASLKNAVEAEVGGSYWHHWRDPSTAPQDAIDKAIQIELDYLFDRSQAGSDDPADVQANVFGTHGKGFIDPGLTESWVENTSGEAGAKSYAELWLITVEKATGGSSPLEDTKVRDFASSKLHYTGNYQETSERRNYAVEVYNRYKDSGTTPTATPATPTTPSATPTGDLNTITSARNANEFVFNVPDSSEWYAGWSNRNNDSMKRVLEHYGDLAYQLQRAIGAPWIAIIVQMRYEDPNSKCGKNNFWGNGCPSGTGVGGASINGTNLGEGFQQYAGTLTNGNHDQAIGITDPKAYLEAIGPTWVQGNIHGAGYALINDMKNSVDALTTYINTPEGQAIVSTFGNYSGTPSSGGSPSQTTTDECGNTVTNPSQPNGSSITGEDIAKYALKLAWPYQGGEDGGELDKCDPDGSGSLVDYDGRYTNSVCNHNPKPAYKEALKNVWGESEANSGCHSSGGVCDCTRFTTTVLVDGGFDTDAKKSSSTELTNYLASDAARDKWDKIDNHSDLQPGDVMVKSGHTFIWLGSMGGRWGNAAQASQGDTVAVVSTKRDTSPFTAYRLKPRGGGTGGTCNFNDTNGEGCTFYCQGGYPNREDWAGDRYASTSPSSCGDYANGGCGPTSLAMVIANMTGDTSVTPPIIGDKSQAVGGRACGSGSIASNLVTVVGDYGLHYETIGFSVSAINTALDAGKVVWFSGKGSSPFSGNGHFIAIRGKTSTGKWLLFDSAGGCSKGAYNSSKREYDPQSVINAAYTSHTGPYAIYH